MSRRILKVIRFCHSKLGDSHRSFFKRIAEGFQINQIENWNQENYLAERKIAEKISHRVYLATGLEFPKEEVDYITLHLISKALAKIINMQRRI